MPNYKWMDLSVKNDFSFDLMNVIVITWLLAIWNPAFTNKGISFQSSKHDIVI
jgi:hypothetical protein